MNNLQEVKNERGMGMPPAVRDDAGVADEWFDSFTSDKALACHVKRFFEYWLADPGFRRELAVDPRQAAAARQLIVDPYDLRFLWDDEYRTRLSRLPAGEVLQTVAPATLEHLARRISDQRFRDLARTEAVPLDPRFRAWRERQRRRCATQFRTTYNDYVPHIPFAIELSKGCSVGCWFCGVSAPRLDGHFEHTEPNARLFVDVLRCLAQFTGIRAGGWGFLYWATDPLDNPYYESFAADFHAVFGRYPAITTAQPLKDPARTRALIAASDAADGSKIRFSILSLGLLHRLFREFTAEELASVDLIPLGKDSIVKVASTGRARERAEKQSSEAPPSFIDPTRDRTISCVSGFLVSMVTRTVSLVSPCNSDDRWPLGYYTYSTRTFENGDDFAAALESLAAHMPLAAPRGQPMRFRRDLTYEPLPDGFRVVAPHAQETVAGNVFIRDLGDLLASGQHSPLGAAQWFHDTYGIDPSISSGWIDRLFDMAVIDEEPARNHA